MKVFWIFIFFVSFSFTLTACMGESAFVGEASCQSRRSVIDSVTSPWERDLPAGQKLSQLIEIPDTLVVQRLMIKGTMTGSSALTVTIIRGFRFDWPDSGTVLAEFTVTPPATSTSLEEIWLTLPTPVQLDRTAGGNGFDVYRIIVQGSNGNLRIDSGVRHPEARYSRSMSINNGTWGVEDTTNGFSLGLEGLVPCELQNLSP